MTEDLQRLKFVRGADVYKAGVLAGHLSRTGRGSVAFSYTAEYLAAGSRPVATTLPLDGDAVESPSGALPAFFSGLLPEGHRLTVLKDAVKTSLGDELSLLLAVGADMPGDVQVVPAGEPLVEQQPLADTSRPEDLDFSYLADAVDPHGLPGVQHKASASMMTTPLALANRRYLLKLDPPSYPHLVLNEAAHLTGAKALKIPVARHSVVKDKRGTPGLLVERFDRAHADGLVRLALEDGAQVMNLPPASKYAVTSEQLVLALAGLCRAKAVAVRNLYLQFVFAWLTGNGDLHAKNAAVLAGRNGSWTVAPMYDIPCTLHPALRRRHHGASPRRKSQGTQSQALAGVRGRHWTSSPGSGRSQHACPRRGRGHPAGRPALHGITPQRRAAGAPVPPGPDDVLTLLPGALD